MKKNLLIGLSMLIAGAVHAQETQPAYLCDRKINWGIKVGICTDLPVIKLMGNDDLWAETTNETDFQADALMRLNFNRFFFQAEAGYNNTSEVFHIVAGGNSANPSRTTIETNVKSSNFSALFGWYSVKRNEFALSVFSGAKIKYAHYLHTDYPGKEYVNDHNSIYNLYVATGLGINISHLFFDFRYDIALRNKDLFVPPSLSAAFGDLRIFKRANVLSFSIGMMF
jgi:hypothetical protein